MNHNMNENDMEDNQEVCSTEEETQEVTPVVEEPTPEAPTVEDAPKKKTGMIIAIAAAAVVLCVIIGLVVSGFFASQVYTDATTETTLEVAQETTVVTSTAGEFTADITLAMVDEDGVFIPHDFTISDDLMTEAMAKAVVATCGDYSLDNATLAYYYYQKYMDMYTQYGSYITMILDPSQSLATQMLSDTQSIQDMLVQGAVYSYQQEAALYNAAMDEGFTMSEDYAAYIADLPDAIAADVVGQGYETAEDYLIAFYGPYATMDSFIDFVTISLTASEFAQAKTADLSYSDEEILAYYEENAEMYAYYGMSKDAYTVNIRHILITPEDDGNATTDVYGAVVYSEESMAAALEKSEALLAVWEEGEATEDAFATLAMENTEDPGSMASGGLYEGVYQGQMVANFDAWCFDASRQYGDTGIVESTYGYHIMFYVGSQEDNSWYDSAAADLLYDGQVAIQEAYVNQYDFAVNYYNVALSPSQLEVELLAAYGY